MIPVKTHPAAGSPRLVQVHGRTSESIGTRPSQLVSESLSRGQFVTNLLLTEAMNRLSEQLWGIFLLVKQGGQKVRS